MGKGLRSIINPYDEIHSLKTDIGAITDSICIEKYATIDRVNELEKKVDKLSSNKKSKRRIKSVTVRI